MTDAMTDASLETAGDRYQLRFERRLNHSVERVWRALTEPEELRQWFPVVPDEMAEELGVAPGGTFEATESEPPRLLAGTWYDEELRFELRPEGDVCVLVFIYTFSDREIAARDAAGWDRCFARLEALLAGEPISEAESLEGWPEIHERYASRFGVDPEVGRKAHAAHPTQE
jgi:uncharacterized protein YndB with AHSA1/START domain